MLDRSRASVAVRRAARLPARPAVRDGAGRHAQPPVGVSPLRALLDSYAQRLIDSGWADLDLRAAVGRHLHNGLVFDQRLRRLLMAALDSGETFGDIFAAEGTKRFLEW